MAPALTRRRALGIAAGLAAGAVAGGIGTPVPTRARAAQATWPSGRSLSPVSMAMHIHACFSEATASMDAHLDQAQKNDIDVVWWTEHDFRVQAHGYRRAVRFEGLVEPEGKVDWTWQQGRDGEITNASATFIDEPHSPDETGKALRLGAVGPAEDWGALTFDGDSWNSTYATSLADTTIELDVLPESTGPDAELVIELSMSYRPASGGRPAGKYSLQYRVGDTVGRSTENQGLRGVMGLQALGTWQRLTLRPVEDIAALWPDLVAGDAVLFKLRLAVRARRGATATAVVDRMRFRRDRREDQEALALQAELISAYESRYPDIRQIQAVELSLVRHINAFGGQVFLPDYGTKPPFLNNTARRAMETVDAVHAHGGLASYNHPDGSDPAALGRELIKTRNLGADLIEVGVSQDVDDLVFAYDLAARNAIFVTATGVTDDHLGESWLGQSTRWITNAWAVSTDTPELVDALSAGRCWVVDPARWRGAMNISAQAQPAMGSVLVTTDRLVPYEVQVTDLPTDSTVEIVVGKADRAGKSVLEPANVITSIPASEVHGDTVSIDVQPARGKYMRAMVRDEAGSVIGFSNPTWVLPKVPPRGIPPNRML